MFHTATPSLHQGPDGLKTGQHVNIGSNRAEDATNPSSSFPAVNKMARPEDHNKTPLAVVATSAGASVPKAPTKAADATVRFSGLVRVCLIPHRSSYSPHVRARLWASRHEIRRNAARNTLEFAYEGWGVTGVVEDDGMILCGGRRVHPIHLFSPDERRHCLASCKKSRGRRGKPVQSMKP